MCQNFMAIIEFYSEHGIWKRFYNPSFYFYTIVFSHKRLPSLLSRNITLQCRNNVLICKRKICLEPLNN